MSRDSAASTDTSASLFHWIPGEMIVVVRLSRLPLNDDLEQVVRQVHAILNEFLERYSLSLETYGMSGRWRLTPSMPPVRRRAFVFGLQRKQPLMALFFHMQHSDQLLYDPLPMALSHIQSHLEYFARRGLHIVSAMPNWLVTAAPLYDSSGGPASPPSSAPLLDMLAPPQTFPGWHIQLNEPTFVRDIRGAEEVVVAVLDTAPHPDRLYNAVARPEFRRNWLLQRLADDLHRDDGSLTIEYDRYPLVNDIRAGRDEQYFLMSDHGLSLVGILRDLAPRAQIRLVRVLNDYGGGDLYTLFAALTDLEREVSSGSIRRLIVNLSLTIMPDIRRLPSIWLDQRPWSASQLTGVMRVLTHIEEGLRLLFDSLAAQGVLVVAAAGNDSTLSRQRGAVPRPPRAPARYESTLSVSSVNSQNRPSTFSNAANLPPVTSGVATFGGDSLGIDDAMGYPEAVRGVYISPTFPSGEQNVTGWADWRGTSFSTPMVSALAAHLMAQGWSAANIITRFAYGLQPHNEVIYGPEPESADLLANIVHVQQRFGL